MTVDLDSLLDAPADEFKAPEALPAGTYYGTITGFKFDKSREKQTDFVRYTIQLSHPDKEAQEAIDEEKITVDWSRKTLSQDFYLTQEAIYRLKDFMTALGIKVSGRSMRELIPEVQGHQVAVLVQKQLDKNDATKAYNRVDQIRPAE